MGRRLRGHLDWPRLVKTATQYGKDSGIHKSLASQNICWGLLPEWALTADSRTLGSISELVGVAVQDRTRIYSTRIKRGPALGAHAATTLMGILCKRRYMNRRTYLQCFFGSAGVGLAGCTGDDSGGGGDGAGDRTSDQSATVSTTTQSVPKTETTPETVAKATVMDSTLQINEGEYRTTAAVTGSIKNTGNVPLLICNAVSKFYNASDELLNTSGWQIMGLLPEEIWLPWLRYTGDGSQVERATLEIDSTNQAQEESLYTDGDSFSIEESNVQIPVDETAMPRITANIRNETGSEVARVRFIGKLYDENGRVLAHGTRVVNNFAADEIWNVEAAINLSQSQVEAIDSHEILFYSLA